MKPGVLIIDDDEEIRTQMKWAIAGEYEVLMAEDRASALEQFKAGRPKVTLLDLGLPPQPNDVSEGMATLAGIMMLDRTAKVIIISGQSGRENAIRAIGAGAFDFLCKPVDTDQMRLLLQRSVFVSELEHEYHQLQGESRPDMFEGMLGTADNMREVYDTIDKVAKSSAPVLILGESGTGKEMVANAIHRRSAFKGKPFIAINCNAIPENLLESELFGYEKGAFTGANMQRIGLIETADGGSIFLDEIGDLPPPVQVKLLRFLQEKRIQRVGGRKELKVETRILAATNIDLEKAVQDGRFREDLYYRLAVVVCRLPALRERGDDVLLLARDFLRRFGAQSDRPELAFGPPASDAITRYAWPGNVRELQNRVQRAVIMAEGRWISINDMELGDFADSLPAIGLKEARENLERDLVRQALKRSGSNITAAAQFLGISRPTFYELMSKLGISKEQE